MINQELDVKVIKIHRLPQGSRVKAFIDLGINDALLIKGIRVIDGREGLFVTMPSELGKDDRWYERVRCLNKDLKHQIKQQVLEAYHQVTT